MKQIFKNYLYLVPIVMLLATIASNFYDYQYYQLEKSLDYILLGNCVGYSLMTDAVFLYIFWFNKSYCWDTRLSPFALIIVNLTDILGVFISYPKYQFLFNISICFVAILLSIIFEISKRRNNES